MPKKCNDLMQNETNKAVRLTAKTVEYISFKVPRKSGTFQADLFPPTRSHEPAMKFDDYINGQNLEPIRFELRPDIQADASQVQTKATFAAKIGASEPVHVAPQHVVTV